LAERTTTALLCPFLQRHARLCLLIEVHLLCCPCKIVPVFSEMTLPEPPHTPPPSPSFQVVFGHPLFGVLVFGSTGLAWHFPHLAPNFLAVNHGPPLDLLTEQKEVSHQYCYINEFAFDVLVRTFDRNSLHSRLARPQKEQKYLGLDRRETAGNYKNVWALTDERPRVIARTQSSSDHFF